MIKKKTPEKWAREIGIILDASIGNNRFPVDVKFVAKEYSKQIWPDDSITLIKGADLPGFEGCLLPAPREKNGWGIIYNNVVKSSGRVNFTLAHEFGHYLLHRHKNLEGFQCDSSKIEQWGTKYGQMEHEANTFAASLLMPINDMRKILPSSKQPNIQQLSQCAERYDVSLLAATFHWLNHTKKRSIVIQSRDGFILKSRSSDTALKTGLFYRSSQETIPLPEESLINNNINFDTEKDHEPGIWFREPCRELILQATNYDFNISILHFEDEEDDDEKETDLFDSIQRGFKR